MRGTSLAILLLAGCSTAPTHPKVPDIVQVPVKQYVAVPPELSADCDPVPKLKNDVDEAVRLANARAESLAECTGRMRQIRALPVTPEVKTP